MVHIVLSLVFRYIVLSLVFRWFDCVMELEVFLLVAL